jgi:small multidrug resistance pump
MGSPVTAHETLPRLGRAHSERGLFLGWLYLFIAIIAEVVGTSALKPSEGFTRPLPAAFVVAGYATSFYFLSLTLRTIPVGIAYAVWAGAGVVLVTLIGRIVLGQTLDAIALLGIALIMSGVLVIYLLSNSVTH